MYVCLLHASYQDPIFPDWFQPRPSQDFEVSVEDAVVNVKSSSRVGDSDLGVNAKRASA